MRWNEVEVGKVYQEKTLGPVKVLERRETVDEKYLTLQQLPAFSERDFEEWSSAEKMEFEYLKK